MLTRHPAAECGVWRGGASIFAKAILTAYGAQRDVHLVDSFQGLPRPTTGNDLDVCSLRLSLQFACCGWPARLACTAGLQLSY